MDICISGCRDTRGTGSLDPRPVPFRPRLIGYKTWPWEVAGHANGTLASHISPGEVSAAEVLFASTRLPDPFLSQPQLLGEMGALPRGQVLVSEERRRRWSRIFPSDTRDRETISPTTKSCTAPRWSSNLNHLSDLAGCWTGDRQPGGQKNRMRSKALHRRPGPDLLIFRPSAGLSTAGPGAS